MTVGSFLNNLATLSKIDVATNEKFKSFIETNKSLLDADLPEEIAGTINGSLLTLDSAKNNFDLKKHFTAQALNGTDAAIERLVNEYQFEDIDKAEFLAEKNTNKKVEMLASKLKTALDKKASTPDGTGKSAALEKEILTLNSQLLDIKNTHNTEKLALQSQFENQILGYNVNQILSSKDYANINDKEVAVTVANQFINKALNESNAKLITKDGKLKLVRNDDTALDYMENNKIIEFNDFADKTLSKHNLLKVSNSTTNTAVNSATQTTINAGQGVVSPMAEYYKDKQEFINS